MSDSNINSHAPLVPEEICNLSLILIPLSIIKSGVLVISHATTNPGEVFEPAAKRFPSPLMVTYLPK